jgi:hypothetical protein
LPACRGVLAFKAPNEVVAADASATGEFVFDIPPSTRRAALRVAGGSIVELALPAPPEIQWRHLREMRRPEARRLIVLLASLSIPATLCCRGCRFG